MKPDLDKEGYSKEEEYFHKLNRELIEKMKEKNKEDHAEKEETDRKEETD